MTSPVDLTYESRRAVLAGRWDTDMPGDKILRAVAPDLYRSWGLAGRTFPLLGAMFAALLIVPKSAPPFNSPSFAWVIVTLAIAGYLAGRRGIHNEKETAGLIYGLLWLGGGLSMLYFLFANYGALQSEVAKMIAVAAKTNADKEMLKKYLNIVIPPPSYLALPLWFLPIITVGQVIALAVFSVLDFRNFLGALSGNPVVLVWHPHSSVIGEAKEYLGATSSSPVAQAAQTPLTTRDTEALKPAKKFSDMSGNDELKAALLAAAREWNGGRKDKEGKAGKNGILLYGAPGTGKTAFADALAGELGLKIMKVNIGSMASRWVNQTTEQLQHVIDSALRQAPCVLFLDEVEAIFPDRGRIERGDSEESKVVGSFLSSIEKLRDGRVLLVAATNYLDRVDEAIARTGRFDFRIEVAVPDFEARKGLILSALEQAGKKVEPAVLERLSRRWAGFNVPRIQEAARRAAGFAATKDVGMRDFVRGLRDVQGAKAGVSESALGLSDLYFDDAVREKLAGLATQFRQSDEIEAHGGVVPKGVIFYGPPGTGKTTMAQALAKEAGWTFVATNGKDIVANPDKLKEIRRKASDLRPAIVFIDEADDILGDRRYSGMKMQTNELLQTIDGAGEPLHDVTWILATNDVDALDGAAANRFPHHIELPIPGREATGKLIRAWAGKGSADSFPGGRDTWSEQVADALDGLAPRAVTSILTVAKTAAATRSVGTKGPVSITLDDVLAARAGMRV